MNEKEFEKLTGYAPEQDDLERVNCKQAGEPGHWNCGWCDVHNKPRFSCLCVVRKNKPQTEKEIFDLLLGIWERQQIVNGKFELWWTAIRDYDIHVWELVPSVGEVISFCVRDVVSVEPAHDGNCARIILKGVK